MMGRVSAYSFHAIQSWAVLSIALKIKGFLLSRYGGIQDKSQG